MSKNFFNPTFRGCDRRYIGIILPNNKEDLFRISEMTNRQLLKYNDYRFNFSKFMYLKHQDGQTEREARKIAFFSKNGQGGGTLSGFISWINESIIKK